MLIVTLYLYNLWKEKGRTVILENQYQTQSDCNFYITTYVWYKQKS